MTLSKDKQTLALKNKSYSYLLPMLGANSNNYKNCSAVFYKDAFKQNLENKLFLLFRMNKEWSNQLHDWLINHPLHEGSYKINSEYKMYYFRIKDEYLSDYNKFIEGRYSEISEPYKLLILNFHKDYSTEKIKKVLYKDESLYLQYEKELEVKIPRDQEISSIPNLELEVFNEKIKEEL